MSGIELEGLKAKTDHEILLLIAKDLSTMREDLYDGGSGGKFKEIFARLRSLERWKWMVAGGLAVLSLLLSSSFLGAHGFRIL